MQITRIRLFDYRSYERMELAPGPGLNVLVGENAAGKTNILESVFLCALGRSHRTRHDGELIRMGQPGAFIGIDLQRENGSHSIECRLKREQPRELKVDGKALSRSGELLGRLNVVLFSPEDLKLVKQGPAERRRFMDMELSQLRPAYYYCLQRYNATLRQRNALLKEYERADRRLLAVWTKQLASLAAEVLLERDAFLQEIDFLAAETHNALSGGKEALELRYEPTLPPEEQETLEKRFFELWMDTAERDAQRGGATAAGPHRDDFRIAINGEDARIYGSQGQQRTAALSLKLAQLQRIGEETGEAPVLLLDDVLSELDGSRQRFLGEAMAGCQTFLTCTELSGLQSSGLDAPAEMAVYRVAGGQIRLEEQAGWE